MRKKRKWIDFTGLPWMQARGEKLREKTPMILIIVFLILANGAATLDMQSMRLCTNLPGGTVNCISATTPVLAEMLKLGLIRVDRINELSSTVMVMWFKNIAFVADVLADIGALIARRQKKFAKEVDQQEN